MSESSPINPPSNPGPGRPRALDDIKRGQICALVSQGCTLSEAARYVGCSLNTIRRAAKSLPQFGEQIRFAKADVNIDPMQAVLEAAQKDWRAAGWWLERTQPERFARRTPPNVDTKLARLLLEDILELLGQEVAEPILHDRLVQLVGAVFEYRVHVATDRRRTRRGLQRAMKLIDRTQATVAGPKNHAKPVAIDRRPQQLAAENKSQGAPATPTPRPNSAAPSTSRIDPRASSPVPNMICVADLPPRKLLCFPARVAGPIRRDERFLE